MMLDSAPKEVADDDETIRRGEGMNVTHPSIANGIQSVRHLCRLGRLILRDERTGASHRKRSRRRERALCLLKVVEGQIGCYTTTEIDDDGDVLNTVSGMAVEIMKEVLEGQRSCGYRPDTMLFGILVTLRIMDHRWGKQAAVQQGA